MKSKDFFRHNICPVIAAVIWGTAFSAQSICSNYLSSFSLNAFRGLLAALVLAMIAVLRKEPVGSKRDILMAGIRCGIPLFLASNLQQFGISETSAGKSGFLTALYIVLVPLLGSLKGQKNGRRIWLAVLLAVIGLYFLCITDSFSIAIGDFALLLCALAFAVQILAIDVYSLKVDCFALSAVQFLVTGILSAICAAIIEKPAAADFAACLPSLLYVALFSSCIAYTLQVYSQKGGNPAVVSLLMSLESVFAVIGGAIILHETMTGREWIGCGLMAAAVVLAQMPGKTVSSS